MPAQSCCTVFLPTIRLKLDLIANLRVTSEVYLTIFWILNRSCQIRSRNILRSVRALYLFISLLRVSWLSSFLLFLFFFSCSASSNFFTNIIMIINNVWVVRRFWNSATGIYSACNVSASGYFPARCNLLVPLCNAVSLGMCSHHYIARDSPPISHFLLPAKFSRSQTLQK